jgi:hypothetical protein
MVSAYRTLPAGAPLGKVRLPGEVLFKLAAVAVPEVSLVEVADVQAETLLVEADGAAVAADAVPGKDVWVGVGGDDDVERLAEAFVSRILRECVNMRYGMERMETRCCGAVLTSNKRPPNGRGSK